jgi:soluble lytic murein transglycosylase
MHVPIVAPTLVLLVLSLLCSAAPAPAGTLDARRGELRSALQQAERGPPLSPLARQTLLDHPLFPYVEYAELRRDLRQARPREVKSLLSRHAALPFAGALRDAWLRELARRGDWETFRRYDRGGGDAELRCHAAQAQLAAGETAELLDAIAALWLHGQSRPDACDPPFARLAAAGRIDAALRWQRIDLAAEAGNISLMRFLARSLPAEQRARAERYATFLEAPQAAVGGWPQDARSRRIAVLGLERLARRDPAAAEALLAAIAAPLGMDAERAAVQYAVALWSAASYLPESARRFARVPATAYDARLHEWRAREALTRNDWPALLAAIEAMPAAQRGEGRWRYLEARAREQVGDTTAAQALLAALADEPNYFGFLAADRLDRPYTLCPLEAPAEAGLRQRLLAMPALQRAIELHAIGRPSWARREWDALQPTLSEAERRMAVALAVEAGWTDRAVFALAQGEDQRLYRLRFPLAHERHLRREAEKRGLDAAWVAALIRAESAWQPEARSHADARGLMQLLPGTAAAVARRHQLDWSGVATLNQPRENISLGTAYLAEMLARHDGQPFLATAAYNAGPTPVARWLGQRPPTDPELWVETIPYRETREYVARIMAFSVIYDWRFGGRALPVGERMRGVTDPQRAVRAFHCPAPAGVPPVAADQDPAREAGSMMTAFLTVALP